MADPGREGEREGGIENKLRSQGGKYPYSHVLRLSVQQILADMGTTQNIFDSNRLSLKKFLFDSTHDSQWLYGN